MRRLPARIIESGLLPAGLFPVGAQPGGVACQGRLRAVGQPDAEDGQQPGRPRGGGRGRRRASPAAPATVLRPPCNSPATSMRRAADHLFGSISPPPAGRPFTCATHRLSQVSANSAAATSAPAGNSNSPRNHARPAGKSIDDGIGSREYQIQLAPVKPPAADSRSAPAAAPPAITKHANPTRIPNKPMFIYYARGPPGLSPSAQGPSHFFEGDHSPEAGRAMHVRG